jgi:hypothetical protein
MKFMVNRVVIQKQHAEYQNHANNKPHKDKSGKKQNISLALTQKQGY